MPSSLSFDTLAPTFEATRGLPPGVGEQLVATVQAVTGIEPGARIIEAGVGTGRIAAPFITAGYDFWGIDISRPMLAACRANLREVDPDERRWSVIQADVTALPFLAGGFDLALTAYLLYLIPDWTRALSELWRLLRPGGWYVEISEESISNSALTAFDRKWRNILGDARDEETDHFLPDAAAAHWLAARGATLSGSHVTTWRRERSVGETLASYPKRIRPLYPYLGDREFAAAFAALATWTARTFASETEPLICDISLELTFAKRPSDGLL